MLFEDNFRNESLKHFEGKTGAWDKKRNLGSHFFWGLSEDSERVRMTLNGSTLASSNGQITVEWTKDDIINALMSRKIYPGMLLKFALVVFYMGLKPFAGFGSANYVKVMQADLLKFLARDYFSEVENTKQLTVNNVTSVPVLLQKNNGGYDNYFAFDVMLNNGLSQRYFDSINSVPVRYFMAPNLKTIYEYAHNLYGRGDKRDFGISEQDFNQLFENIIT